MTSIAPMIVVYEMASLMQKFWIVEPPESKHQATDNILTVPRQLHASLKAFDSSRLSAAIG
jgi:hypothetical protein